MVYKEEHWSAPDEMASEFEVHDFLFGLVRLTKPLVVVETGSYKGHASRIIGLALRGNNRGTLYTCDTDLEMVKATIKMTEGLPVVVSGLPSWKLLSAIKNVDLAFLDSSTDRAEEAKLLNLAPGAIVVLHDARRDYGPLPWASAFFPTPRGLRVYFTS
jgi:predicted O-methyltransferase YrrM